MLYILYVLVRTFHAPAWIEIYIAAIVGAFMVLVGVAVFAAIFIKDDQRGLRAKEVASELLKVFRRRDR